jgi:regulator of protease activity HflC (stomatin/prohibitin superfamily)
MDAIGIVGAVIVLLVLLVAIRTVRIVPQAKARNVERLGRYRKTLEPGMNFIIPLIDRVKPLIDLREQVVSFLGQPVITEDNLVVKIDTVLFFQVTDPRAADYEIVDYIQAIEQLTATMLRSVIGSMDLEQSLTSRDQINTMLRGVLDDASGKWGIRVTRVEIKAIDPPTSVKEAMEKQMRAEREKRAAVLNAEGIRQSQILTADGDKQGTVLRAEGDKQSAILRAQGQAEAITTVFASIHEGDPDPKLLAYQYLQTLPQLAQGPGNTVWMIPSELTGALKALGSAFGSEPDVAAAAGGAAGATAAGGRSAAGTGAASAGAADAAAAGAADTSSTAGSVAAGSVTGGAAASGRMIGEALARAVTGAGTAALPGQPQPAGLAAPAAQPAAQPANRPAAPALTERPAAPLRPPAPAVPQARSSGADESFPETDVSSVLAHLPEGVDLPDALDSDALDVPDLADVPDEPAP